MNRARFDIAFLAMSLSFSLGIGVTEIVHRTSSVESRSGPKALPLLEQKPGRPSVNTGSAATCRSVDLDDLSRLHDDLNWELIKSHMAPFGKNNVDKVKTKKRAALVSKIKQLKLYLDKHRYDHYNGDFIQTPVYREKCYTF